QAWDFRVRAAVTALQVHANLGGEQGAGRAKTTTRVDGNYDQGSAAQQQARAAMKLATIIAIALLVALATPAAARSRLVVRLPAPTSRRWRRRIFAGFMPINRGELRWS